jgi:hypothetical protein
MIVRCKQPRVRSLALGHWDIFRQTERDHPDLIAALADEIRKYAAGLTEVNSTTAGAAILPKWARRGEWSCLCGSNSSQLFGMVVWVTLFDDAQMWRTVTETVDGRQVRIYRRA